jgi:MoxR-like ATPase
VAASNEVPADEALHAFYDRFLVRVPVQPVGDEAFAALLSLPLQPPPPVQAPLLPAEVSAIAEAAAAVQPGEDFVAACRQLRAWLAARGAPLSDRRWRQWLGLARTAAASEGRALLDRFDLWTAPFVATATPAEVPALAAWFEDTLLALPPTEAPWLERAVAAFEQQLELEQRLPAEDGKDEAGKLALARAIGGAQDEGGGMARIVSERLEAQLHRRFSPLHVAARTAQVDALLQRLQAEHAAVAAALAAQQQALAGRLWMPPELQAKLHARHAAALDLLDGLAARLVTTRAGFAALPLREATATDTAPDPVTLETA